MKLLRRFVPVSPLCCASYEPDSDYEAQQQLGRSKIRNDESRT